MTAKLKQHNEYFMPVSLGHRKSCNACKALLPSGESIYAHGEYAYGKWYTVGYVCIACWNALREKLLAHTAGCHCTVTLHARSGYRLPEWLTLDREKSGTV